MAIRAAELEVLVTANTSQAEAGLNRVKAQIGAAAAGYGMSRLGGEMLGFAKDFVTAGADFEQSLIFVTKLAGETTNRVEELRTKAFAVDQASFFGPQQIIESMEQLARESFSMDQIIGTPGQFDGMIDGALSFAAAIDENVQQSTNLYGNFMRVFREQNLSSADAADTLTQAILLSGRSGAEFATAFQYVGAPAAQLGVAAQDTAQALALMAREGIRTRSAGTALRTMFVELSDPMSDANQFLTEFGGSALDAQGNFVGMPSIINQFGDALNSLPAPEALTILSDAFGKPAASALLALFKGGTEAWDELGVKMNEIGSASGIMDARMDTLAGSIDKMAGAWFRLKTQLGSSSEWFTRPIVDGIAAILNILVNAEPWVLKIASGFIILGGALLSIGGFILLATVGFGLLATGAGTLFGLLIALVNPLTYIGALFGILLSPIGLIAAGLLYVAYAFGLFDGGINTLIPSMDKLHEAFDRVGLMFDFYTNIGYSTITAGIMSVSAGLRVLFGDNAISDFLDKAAPVAGYLMDIARGGRVSSDALKDLPPVWRSMASGLGLVGATIRTFLSDIGSGDFDGAFEHLKVNLGLMGNWFDRLWEDQIAPAVEQAGGVSGILKTIGGTIIFDIIPVLAAPIKAVLGNIWGWVLRQAFGGDTDAMAVDEMLSWGGVGSGATMSYEHTVGELILNVVPRLAEGIWGAAGNLKDWVAGQLFGTGGSDRGSKAEGYTTTSAEREIDGGLIGLKFGLAGATFGDGVNWAEIAATLLVEADTKMTAALGLARTDAEMTSAETAGEAWGENLTTAFGGGVETGVGNASKTKADTDIWTQIKAVWNWTPPGLEATDPSIIDEWKAFGDGIAGGIQEAVYQGIQDRLDNPPDRNTADSPFGANFAASVMAYLDQSLWIDEAVTDPDWLDKTRFGKWLNEQDSKFGPWIDEHILDWINGTETTSNGQSYHDDSFSRGFMQKLDESLWIDEAAMNFEEWLDATRFGTWMNGFDLKMNAWLGNKMTNITTMFSGSGPVSSNGIQITAGQDGIGQRIWNSLKEAFDLQTLGDLTLQLPGMHLAGDALGKLDALIDPLQEKLDKLKSLLTEVFRLGGGGGETPPGQLPLGSSFPIPPTGTVTSDGFYDPYDPSGQNREVPPPILYPPRTYHQDVGRGETAQPLYATTPPGGGVKEFGGTAASAAGFVDRFKESVQSAMVVVPRAGAAVGGAVVPMNLLRGASGTLRTAFTQVGTAAGPQLAKVPTAAQSSSTQTQGIFVRMGIRMVQIAQVVTEAFAITIRAGGAAVSGAASSLVAAALAPLANLPQAYHVVGQAAGASLASGLRSQVGAVAAAAEALAAAATSAASAGSGGGGGGGGPTNNNQRGTAFSSGGGRQLSSLGASGSRVVNQTNNINMSASSIPELVNSVQFINSLNRERQLQFG